LLIDTTKVNRRITSPLITSGGGFNLPIPDKIDFIARWEHEEQIFLP
jgi:hypothetical protein